jgi:hypothetical protein
MKAQGADNSSVLLDHIHDHRMVDVMDALLAEQVAPFRAPVKLCVCLVVFPLLFFGAI